jgi:hypothetical protein
MHKISFVAAQLILLIIGFAGWFTWHFQTLTWPEPFKAFVAIVLVAFALVNVIVFFVFIE